MKTRLSRRRPSVRLGCRPRVEAVESRLVLSTFSVTTTADGGAGSLRQAILDANSDTSPSIIDFNIAGGGAQTIIPTSPLPAITNATTIDATTEPGYAGTPIVQINGSQIYYQTTPPSHIPIPGVNGLTIQAGSTTVEGLVINRFTGNGIEVDGNGRDTIQNDYIGTDATGLNGLGNSGSGIYLNNSRNNTIGGTTAGQGNLISSNGGSGIVIASNGQGVVGGNVVEGNRIGTDVNGGNLGNTYDGVTVNSSNNNTIGGAQPGAANVLAYNGGDGVKVGNFSYSGQTLSTLIQGNSIHDNAGYGIELSSGTNNPVSSAMLTSASPSGTAATVIKGAFYGQAATTYQLEFFSNPVAAPSGAGQGQTLIGSASVTTDSGGLGRIAVTLPTSVPLGQSISALATGPSNNTSNFFKNATVTTAPPPNGSVLMVTTTADSGPGSLRQAILDANGQTTPATIDFAIGTGVQTIIPASPLPTITNPVTIDATTEPGYAGTPIVQINGSQIFFPPNRGLPSNFPIPGVNGLTIQAGSTTVEGLVINRFTGNGIEVDGNGRDTIQNDYIGTDATGLNGLGNSGSGIYLNSSRSNTIGGTTAGQGNLISSNGGSGIVIASGSGQGVAGGNVVEGNRIGTDVNGGNLGNTYDGVTINTSDANTIGGTLPGAANELAFNGGDGVKVGNFSFSGQTINTAIISNSIHDNAALGIELSYGANNPVSSATLTSAFPSGTGGTVVQGSFRGSPSTMYRLQFFSNPAPDPSGAGQGQTLVGSATVTTDATGLGRIAVTLPTSVAVGRSLSALATGPASNTSTFFTNTTVAASATSDVAQIQTANASAVTAGGTLTYNISFSNLGPSNATGVVVTDTLPAGLVAGAIRTSQGTASQSNGVVRVAVGDLAAHQVGNIQIIVTTTTAGTIENTVTIAANQPDPNPANNTSTLPVVVVANPNPLVIVGGRLFVGLTSVDAMTLNFNQPLDPAQATNPINYRLLGLNHHGQFKVNIPLKPVVYNPSAATVTITPTKPLPLGKVFQLELDGQGSAGITNPAGSLLTGNTSAGPMGPWYLQIGRGYLVPSSTAHAPKVRATGLPKLVESVVTRRVLSGYSNPLSESTTGGTNSLVTGG